jgi:hypothetical protein
VSKGDHTRPRIITSTEWDEAWQRTFGKPDDQHGVGMVELYGEDYAEWRKSQEMSLAATRRILDSRRKKKEPPPKEE